MLVCIKQVSSKSEVCVRGYCIWATTT